MQGLGANPCAVASQQAAKANSLANYRLSIFPLGEQQNEP